MLPAVTLLAVLTITASAEYELARTVLNQLRRRSPGRCRWPSTPTCWPRCGPAPRRGRRLGRHGGSPARRWPPTSAVGLPARCSTGPVTVTAPLATAIMTVLVVVAWRAHVLIERCTRRRPDRYARPECRCSHRCQDGCGCGYGAGCAPGAGAPAAAITSSSAPDAGIGGTRSRRARADGALIAAAGSLNPGR